MSLRRRDLLRGGIGILGASFLKYEDLARAADTPDHFFLFIELKGGIAWQLATDARDLAELPLEDPKVVRTLALSEDGSNPPFTSAESAELLGMPGAKSMHGNVIVLPFVGSLEESYRKGTTNRGCAWRLGVSAHALERHVDDIAVVRGVRNIHNFHGGANDETFAGIFSDRSDQKRKHVAGTLAAHLSRERGALLLDNIVLEGATFSGRPDADFLAPMRIDVRSLGVLAATQTGETGTPEQRFARARQLADAVGSASALGPNHRDAFAAYLSSLGKAPAVQKRLAEIAGQLGTSDASLDMDRQVDTALTLFETRLTRVATLAVGTRNATNNADGNGLFDGHYGVFHKAPDGASRARTYGHFMNVRDVMKSVARLIGLLKSKQLNGKSLFEQTTVVLSTEFSRTSNFSGNEDNGPRLGFGHYYFNNNFILFGKGIKGGTWIGQNDPVTQYAHLTKMATLDQPDPNAIAHSVPSFFTLNPTTNVRTVPSDGRIEGLACESAIRFVGGEERPLMPKDVMRTLYATAGIEPKFRESYGGNWFSDARAIRPLVG
jgi:hypothetical protein